MPTSSTQNGAELEELLRRIRVSPEERERIRSSVPPMRPLLELLDGKPCPATPEELADLEDWLAER